MSSTPRRSESKQKKTTSSTTASSSSSPQLIGIPDGPSVANKDTVMEEIHQMILNSAASSSSSFQDQDDDHLFELILVDSTGNSWWKRLLGPFGHACLRYRHPVTKEDVVANIVGLQGAQAMCAWVEASEYFYGTNFGDNGLKSGNEQAGVYNRQFWGLRLGPKVVSRDQIIALHAQCVALEKSHKCGARKFQLTGATFNNFFHRTLPIVDDILADPQSHLAVTGNCALWSSESMVSAGIVPTKRQFPKALFIDCYERYQRENPSQVKVVEYREVNYADPQIRSRVTRFYKGFSSIPSLVHPLLPIKSFRFWNLTRMADVIVEVKVVNESGGGVVKAVPRRGPAQRPHATFVYRNLLFLVIASYWIGQKLVEANNSRQNGTKLNNSYVSAFFQACFQVVPDSWVVALGTLPRFTVLDWLTSSPLSIFFVLGLWSALR